MLLIVISWKSGIARTPYLVGNDSSLRSSSEQMFLPVIDGIRFTSSKNFSNTLNYGIALMK